MTPWQRIKREPVYAQFMPAPARGLSELWLPAGTGPRERIYFPIPDYWSNTAKAVRFQFAPSVGNRDNIRVVDILDTTVTLVDADGREFVSSLPMRRYFIGPMGAFGQQRGLPIYIPRRWDPLKSYVQSWKGFPQACRVQLLVDYIDPQQ